MRIALLAATHRGLAVLRRLHALAPAADFSIFSFREEPWEPPFLDTIREETERIGGTFFETRKIGEDRLAGFWDTVPVDLILAVSWRYMIPPEVYGRAKLGAFVFHDSLLPAYRGFAPTAWAVINGEDHTGVTLFEISPDVDAGDIVDQRRVAIGPDETMSTIIERVTVAYMELLEKNLEALLNGTSVRRPQDHTRATYTCRRTPEDGQIGWNRTTRDVLNLIRGAVGTVPGRVQLHRAAKTDDLGRAGSDPGAIVCRPRSGAGRRNSPRCRCRGADRRRVGLVDASPGGGRPDRRRGKGSQ